jgi:hypothetical protein
VQALFVSLPGKAECENVMRLTSVVRVGCMRAQTEREAMHMIAQITSFGAASTVGDTAYHNVQNGGSVRGYQELSSPSPGR